MKRDEILDVFRTLANSQGRYGRLVNAIEAMASERQAELWEQLEAQRFNDAIDVIMYMETEV